MIMLRKKYEYIGCQCVLAQLIALLDDNGSIIMVELIALLDDNGSWLS